MTRVDVALDLYAPLMRDCYISLEGARTGKVIDSNDDLLTIHIGSDASRYFATSYEKVEKVAKHNRNSIMLTASDKLRLFTRIEIRVKPKKHEVLLANLDSIANLSKMIEIYPKAMMNDPMLPKEFVAALASATMTIPEARALFMGNEYCQRSKRRKIAKVLAKHGINLVDNYDELWAYYYLFKLWACSAARFIGAVRTYENSI